MAFLLETEPEPPIDVVVASEQIEEEDNLVDLLDFEAEEEPEEFSNKSTGKAVSDNFVAPVRTTPISSINKDADWEIDPSPVWITGDGINSEMTVSSDQDSEYNFLKIRGYGARSRKRAVMRSGTKISIDPEICQTWAIHFCKKGKFNQREIETLINLCDGNSDMEELRINLQQTLEAAGLELIDENIEENFPLWDTRSDILLDDLAEAIEATFTRATRLPGTQSFDMDKSREMQLFEPIVRAKRELQMNILACKPAVETILGVIDIIELIHHNSVASKSIGTMPCDRTNNEENENFFKVADTLKFWQTNGRTMDGKRRREAFEALETLNLSLTFFKEIVKTLREDATNLDDATRMDKIISTLETATERIILEHLPHVRRFASRNVEDGEDPEDVFQVAFMGLQRSIRSFDPNLERRFSMYCTYWMSAFLKRWRANENATIRIPVHLHESVAELDRAMEDLDLGFDRVISNKELADKLEWKSEKVKLLRRIPRQSRHPDSMEEWEEVFPESEIDNSFDLAETKWIVANILEELPEREADIIRKRFGIGHDDEMSLREIGQRCGVTRERIRQIEARGFARLRNPRRKRYLQTLLGT